MSDTSPSYLRGFIVPYNNLGTANLWSAQSSYTQAENTAGDPVPQQSSRLIVRGAGSQSASSDLQIITQRAGHVRNGAAFTWKNNNLVSTDQQGQNAPNALSNLQVTMWEPSARTISKSRSGI